MFYFEGIVNVKRIPKVHCAEFYETGKCSGKLPLDIVYCTLCRNYKVIASDIAKGTKNCNCFVDSNILFGNSLICNFNISS